MGPVAPVAPVSPWIPCAPVVPVLPLGIVKFKTADEVLGYSISKIILEGPKEDLDLTENTQPAIFLASYSIFEMIKKESNIDLGNAKYFAGHSLGEYSALAASGSLDFKDAIKLLNQRGKAMQTAVPKGAGGMLAVLGVEINEIHNLLEEKRIFIFLLSSILGSSQISPRGLNRGNTVLLIQYKAV